MKVQRSLLQRSYNPAMSMYYTPQRNFAASEKQLKARMKSVGSIGKITKAMKMVSASKMKGDLARLAAGRNYGNQAVDMIFKSDQFMQRKMPAEVSDPNICIVPITSDKGLCGAVNSAIVRQVKKYFAEGHATRSKCQIFSIGEKGTSGLTRPFPDILKTSISQVGTPYNYPTVMAMAVHIS
jgi:F-type H+-transporting ATPase subunit gamma